jgi:NADH dehydrogenase (ubiquinone) 1 alpha subcomplex subunit 8
MLLLQNLEKVIPDQPKQSTPVHLRQKQIFAHKWIQRWEKPYVPGQTETPESS